MKYKAVFYHTNYES